VKEKGRSQKERTNAVYPCPREKKKGSRSDNRQKELTAGAARGVLGVPRKEKRMTHFPEKLVIRTVKVRNGEKKSPHKRDILADLYFPSRSLLGP